MKTTVQTAGTVAKAINAYNVGLVAPGSGNVAATASLDSTINLLGTLSVTNTQPIALNGMISGAFFGSGAFVGCVDSAAFNISSHSRINSDNRVAAPVRLSICAFCGAVNPRAEGLSHAAFSMLIDSLSWFPASSRSAEQAFDFPLSFGSADIRDVSRAAVSSQSVLRASATF